MGIGRCGIAAMHRQLPPYLAQQVRFGVTNKGSSLMTSSESMRHHWASAACAGTGAATVLGAGASPAASCCSVLPPGAAASSSSVPAACSSATPSADSSLLYWRHDAAAAAAAAAPATTCRSTPALVLPGKEQRSTGVPQPPTATSDRCPAPRSRRGSGSGLLRTQSCTTCLACWLGTMPLASNVAPAAKRVERQKCSWSTRRSKFVLVRGPPQFYCGCHQTVLCQCQMTPNTLHVRLIRPHTKRTRACGPSTAMQHRCRFMQHCPDLCITDSSALRLLHPTPQCDNRW